MLVRIDERPDPVAGLPCRAFKTIIHSMLSEMSSSLMLTT